MDSVEMYSPRALVAVVSVLMGLFGLLGQQCTPAPASRSAA